MKKLILSWIMIWAGYALMGQQPNFIPNITGQIIIDRANNNGPATINDDHFGSAVANIGDLDLDGVEDIVVGANGDDNGGVSTNNYGAIYICFMNSNKTVKSSVKIGKATSGIGSDISAGDNFGSSIAGLGDMDGDGYLDIVVGAASTSITSYAGSGAIYVLFLHKTGTILSYKKIVRGSNGGPTTIKPGSSFGISVANLGDINNDLTVDIAVGGHNHDGPSSGNDNGAVWILRMNKSGQVIGSQIVTKSTGWSVVLNNSDEFGVSLVSPGDLDQDGINDLLVGSWGDDEGGANLGCVYLLHPDSSGLITSYKKYKQPYFKNIFQEDVQTSFGRSLAIHDFESDGLPEIIVGSSNEGAFYIMCLDSAENITDMKRFTTNIHWNNSVSGYGIGVTLASLNDIDQDGKSELLAGAYIYDTPTYTNNGAVVVIEMDTVYSEINIGDILSYDKYGAYSDSIATLIASDAFGVGVCDLGDVNGDGYHDIAVGTQGDDDGGAGSNRGAVYIIFLDSLQQKISVQKISSTAGGFGTGLANGDNFGHSVCGPGDLDGDTIPDLIVGAWMDDDGGSNRGCIWVIYLNSNGTVKSKQKISSTHGGFGGTLINTGQFGCSVAAIGDINNDGIGDLAVGQNADSDGGAGHGALWILFMNAADSVSGYQKISDTQGNFLATFSGTNPFFGISVCAAGDLNADGKEDIIAGSSNMDGTGAVYVLYLDTLGKVSDYKKINSSASNFPVTVQSGSGFGGSVAVLDDQDGNGYKEIVIGNPIYNSFGSAKGSVWLAFPDSAYNILSAEIIGEETPYFNGSLELSDLFGRSLTTYTASDNTQRLFIGNRATEKASQGGGVFKIEVASFKSLLHLPYVSSTKYYVNTRKEIDGGYYLTNNGKLNVRYEGEYDSSYPLKFKVYNQNYDVVATDAMTGILGTANTQSFGENFYTFNFASVPLTYNQFYILEITNQKKEKEFLRFKYAPFIIIGTPK